ncbi:FAD-binding oxidoreductase [Rubrobacter calidifluminis]|uniref:FAD-binding oxidoreductase n=1 Tax=Rubrobacter calidifluminis TaxID=1392640 RepID=UPI00236270C0|nr:FAD-binding oxidoreductase [Rubrobacter calidifluminis]
MSTFEGKIYWRGEYGYEEERTGAVFNARKPDRFPAAILKAAGENDVMAGVRLARERGLKVSVRSGGHSWVGWGLRDEALLIDLSQIREISLDPDSMIVRASPAVNGGAELDPFLARHGLFFPGGHCPGPGLGGFLLQGGMGWNCRGWGWACERIEAVDVVTADGEPVRADENQNADLLWAARGAGPGFFGVVTRFHLRTMPRPGMIAQSTYVYPLDLYEEVMHWIYEVHTDLAPSVELVVVGCRFPLPQEARHQGDPVIVVDGVAFVDTLEEATRALSPLETCPVVDRALVQRSARPTTMEALRAIQRNQNPEGHRYAADNAWLSAGPGDAVPALRELFATIPNEKSFVLWFSMSPLRQIPDMALSLQTDVYLAVYTIWEDEADDEACQRWLTSQMRRIEPITAGLFLADADLVSRPARFMAEDNWRRLQKLRTRYDPDGLFCSYLAAEDVPLNTNKWTIRSDRWSRHGSEKNEEAESANSEI